MKRKAKSLPKLKAELQILFNAWIRKRDEGLPCISCGEFKELQAGHYYPVQGYDGLRFDEFNVHGECAGCNCFDDSHLIHYTFNLPDRIGANELKSLHSRAAEYKKGGYKWSKYGLIEMIKEYKDKLKT